MSDHPAYLSDPANTNKRPMRIIGFFYSLFIALFLLLACSTYSLASAPAGYSEYYIPGDEDNMNFILGDLDTAVPAPNTMHAIITVTAWSDNTTVYYDHWENGYNFDPTNPAATADETVILTNAGDQRIFESTGMAIPRSSATTYYDGRDRIYVAGGTVTVSRTSWVDGRGIGNQGVAWEIYPVQPQLTTYVLPFGENLGFADFSRVYVLIQATEDNTTVTVDLNADGTPDILNQNRDNTWNNPGDSATVTLNRGQTFLLDRISACRLQVNCTSAPATLNAGAIIQGSKTLQVKFVAGAESNLPWIARGFSVFPRGFWTKDYYAPLGDPVNTENTDYYLYNPSTTAAITIIWDSRTATGSFTIPANSTVSFRTASGTTVPVGSGLYFKGSDIFWGVGSNNLAGVNTGYHEWGFSLLPSTMLYTEHFLGWALGYDQTAGAQPAAEWDNMGIFITPAQDNTRIFVDFNNDGTADQTFTLDRLQTQYVYDTVDGNLSQAHIWATGNFSMVYGENSDLAPAQQYGMDIGYVAIPGSDFVSLVLTVDKSVSPEVVSTALGSTSIFTLTVNSQKYTVDSIRVLDMLPANWQYLGPTSITLPDMTTVTTAPTVTAAGAALPAPFTGNCPAGGGSCLTWDNSVLGNMAENQQITISFTAQTTAILAAGTLSQNRVKAIGTRTFGTPSQTQTFTTTDFAYVASGGPTITKTSGAADPVSPGDTIPYTVTVTNPAAATANLTGISIYDPLPSGTSYVAGSGSVTCNRPSVNVRDEFASAAYNLNGPNNIANWAGNWTETDINGIAGPTAGFVWATGTALQFRYQASNYLDNLDTGFYNLSNGTNPWTSSPWTETGDDGSATTGTIIVDGGNNNRLQFGPGAVGRVVSRTAAVTGNSVSVNFTLSDQGIDNSEGVIAEYDIDGDAFGFREIQRITNGTLSFASSPVCAVLPCTLNTTGATYITLRFRDFETAGNNTYEAGDFAGVDAVSIAVSDAVGSQIQRTANLTGAVNPLLNFTFASANLDAGGDILVVEASSSPVGPFTTLATIDGGAIAPAGPYNLTPYISATTTVRFRITNGFNTAGETLSIDNVDITYASSGAFSSGNPPDFLASSAGCVIAPGSSLTLTFNVTVDDPFPSGQTSITNTASTSSVQIPMAVTASATNTVLVPSSLSASTGGRVWLDVDADGVQDIGEPGIPNIEVTLKDQFGTPIATTLTDGNGRYLFTGITPGTGYYVEVTDGLSAGLSQTFPYTTVPGDLTNNRTSSFDLVDGQVYTSGNIGYRASAGTASFGDQVWVDADADAIRDSGEVGMGGVTLKLYQDRNANSIVDPLTDLPDGPGTVSATNGSAAVVGSGTAFAAVNAGDAITIGGVAYTVLSVADATHLTLTTNYGEATGAGKAYAMPYATVSNPDGTYLFTGAPATGSEDYIVWVTTPAGYLPTGPGYFTYNNVTAGSTLLIADFGFRGDTVTTYSIKDRIWVDTDGDGIFDAGENGLAGVTIELLDASLNVIGTTISASDGTFIFSGMAGNGADYTVRINDTGGVLLDFYGTTSYSLALKRTEVNVTASIDRAATPPPSFGFRALRSIGDTVFNDIDGDGTLDAGEPGIAGVVVSLYRDINGNGVINAGDTLVGSVTTDASGQYLFSGLANASYIVSVPTPVGFTFTGPGADSDGATAGTQKGAAIAGGASVLTVDFGFQAATPRTVSGTLWNDLDADGIIDAGESLLSGVTVDILSGGTVIATVSTNASGVYTLAGLASGIYTVRVTDINSVLTGYDSTFEKTGGTLGPFDYEETVDLTGGNIADVKFGFLKKPPTLVALSDFSAYADNGRFIIRWSTSSEVGTAGFYLFRLDDRTGRYRQINSSLLPALLTSPQGGTYSLIDNGASFTKSNTYLLVEIEAKGKRNTYGPFSVTAGSGNAAENGYSVSLQAAGSSLVSPESLAGHKAGRATGYADQEVTMVITNSSKSAPVHEGPVADEISDYARTAKSLSAGKKAGLHAMNEARTKASLLKKQKTGNMIKLSVSKDGLYYMDSAEIASLLGLAVSKVEQLIGSAKLALSNQGRNIAYVPADGMAGLFFFGQAIDSQYTKENIYWLYKGKGLQMTELNGIGPDPSAPGVFLETIHAEEDKVAAPVLAEGPQSDYWFWDYVVSGNPSLGVRVFELQTFGITGTSSPAALTMRLHGLTAAGSAHDHHVVISLNGTIIGEDRWKGAEERIVDLSFSHGLLVNGTNQITVKGLLDTGAPYSILFVDSFDLTYQRLLKAREDSLTFTAENAQPLTVSGFSGPDLYVFDITVPDRPVFQTALTIDGEAGDYRVSFIPAAGSRYLAAASDSALPVVDAWADSPSRLSSRKNKADYLIITTKELAAAARELADYRAGQDLRSMVVDLEDIMDEFNHGLSSPEAIHDFLAYAYANWKIAPKYVLLAGDGTYDYKDNMGIGDNLVPTLMTETPDGISPSDNLLADMDGDHVPDIAIGRLPVLTAEELHGVVGKIIAYEGNAGNRVVMLADNQDDGGDFPSDSDEIAALVPPGYSLGKIYLSGYTLAQARQLLINDINSGAAVLNYTGHAGLDLLANEGLLRTSDVDSLQNSGRPFVLAAMTCTVGNFALPGYDSLSEALVAKGQVGAAAVWAPTGLSYNSLSKVLDEHLFRGAFGNRGIALGDAILGAFRNYHATGGPAYIMDIFNLQGDPALRMR